MFLVCNGLNSEEKRTIPGTYKPDWSREVVCYSYLVHVLLLVPWSFELNLINDFHNSFFFCFLSGTPNYLFFQIELFPPPLGEGETYKALRKDVRPTLDWSPEDGWTLPSTVSLPYT